MANFMSDANVSNKALKYSFKEHSKELSFVRRIRAAEMLRKYVIQVPRH
jgi:hypothetical protein